MFAGYAHMSSCWADWRIVSVGLLLVLIMPSRQYNPLTIVWDRLVDVALLNWHSRVPSIHIRFLSHSPYLSFSAVQCSAVWCCVHWTDVLFCDQIEHVSSARGKIRRGYNISGGGWLTWCWPGLFFIQRFGNSTFLGIDPLSFRVWPSRP